jgi:multiple sugar transport system permease protein
MPGSRSFWRQVYQHRNAYLFISPFFLVFIAFMVFPIAFSLYLSFLSWNGIMASRTVGLSHYVRAFWDPGFHNALLNTAIFTAFTVAVSTAAGLGLAIFLNSVRVMKRFYRGVFFIPAIVSLVVVALVWKLMLNSEIGMVNRVLNDIAARLAPLLGQQWTPQSFRFLNNPNPYVPLFTIAFVNVWVIAGFNTVIYLAGLQGVPTHLYEASRIDGANAFQNFRSITFPLLRPTTFFVVLISTIDALQVFVLPNVMNRDSDATMTVVYYLYRNAFEFYKMGYASAIAYILFAITVLLGLGIRSTLGREARLAEVE